MTSNLRMLKPPIPRLGGKSRLRKEIIKRFPEHTCYGEPFFGVGWVFFGKEQSRIEVINDVDGELINLFKMLKFHAEEIQRLMKYEISSRDLFYIYRGTDPKTLTEIQRAVRYMYIVSQSFAAKGDAFGYKTTTRPSPQIFDVNHLIKLKERLRNTYIENLDYKQIIEKYDRKHSFFFCDPPYLDTYNKFSADSKVEFGKKEHEELCSILKGLKGKFLLTVNDHEYIRKLYKGFKIAETKVNYSVSKSSEGRKKYNELIITNYEYEMDIPKEAAYKAA